MPLIFKNCNGRDYCILAGNDKTALLRETTLGGYVVAWGLDWDYECWDGGSYYAADEFDAALKTYSAIKEVSE